MAETIFDFGQQGARLSRVGCFDEGTTARRVLSMPIGGAAKQVTIAVVNAATDAVYTLRFRPEGGANETITFNEGAAGTVGSKAAGLALAINANAVAGRHVIASSASDTLTLTALEEGRGFTLSLGASETQIDAPSTTTANADAPDILPGCAVVREYGTSGNKAKVTRPNEDNAVAKVMTVTPADATNAEFYSITVTGDLNGDGVPESYVCPAYTSGSATVAEIVDHFCNWANATFPAASILATQSATVLTLTAEIAGLDFGVVANVAHDIDADAAPTGTLAVATPTANVAHEFAGVALWDGTLSYDAATDTTPYRASRGNIVSVGAPCPAPIWVRLDDDVTSIALTDPVGVRVNADGAGEVFGSYSNAKSGTDICVLPLSRARWASTDVNTDLDGHLMGLVVFQ